MIGTEHQATNGHMHLFSRPWIAQARQQRAQNTFRTHATLLREQWRELDLTLIRIADQYMAGVSDLRDRGLTHTVGSIGFAASQYNAIGEMEPATVDMDPSASGSNQRLSIAPHLVPLPFVFEDYHFNAAELAATQQLGMGLDTAHAEEAMRKVMEGFESILFNGTTVGTYQANTVFGYRTHPQRKTGSAAGAWSTPTNIYPTIMAMFTDMLARRRLGPYALYMNIVQWGELHAEKGVDVNWNVLKWVQESFPTIVLMKPTFAVPDGELVLVELTSRTVDLAVKMEPGNIPWEEMGGLAEHVRVMGSLTPRIKVDGENLVGVVHYTAA
jgi:uncharacterized linocin/CFP29 family protein